MPVLVRRPQDTAPAALRGHDRRLEALERRRGLAPTTTLPTNPAVGTRVMVPHATGVWEVQWSGSAWVFVGGSDLTGYTDAEITTSVNTYPASPQGPTVTVPRAGTYDVWIEARHRHAHTAVLFTGMCAMVGAVAVGQAREPVLAVGAQSVVGSWSSAQAGIALAAGAVIGVGFRAPNGSSIATFYAWRQIRVRPRTLT
jgi:hypothetical protein